MVTLSSELDLNAGIAASRVVVVGSDVRSPGSKEPLFKKASSSKPRSKSRSSSESGLRWPIKEKPSDG